MKKGQSGVPTPCWMSAHRAERRPTGHRGLQFSTLPWPAAAGQGQPKCHPWPAATGKGQHCCCPERRQPARDSKTGVPGRPPPASDSQIAVHGPPSTSAEVHPKVGGCLPPGPSHLAKCLDQTRKEARRGSHRGTFAIRDVNLQLLREDLLQISSRGREAHEDLLLSVGLAS